MAADKVFTFDRADADGGACRPSLAQIGDAQLIDDEEHPPINDGSEPYADQLNQRAMQIYGASKMIDAAKFVVDWSGGAPVLVYFKCPGDSQLIGDFAIAAAGGGTGDFTITFTTTKLVPLSTALAVTCNSLSDSVGVGTVSIGSPSATQTQIRVQTRTGGTLANVRCTVTID